MPSALTRVLLRVRSIQTAVAFYDIVLDIPGRQITPGRCHYQCGDAELALYDPVADGDMHDTEVTPGQTQVYFAVNDLEAAFASIVTQAALSLSPSSKSPGVSVSLMRAIPQETDSASWSPLPSRENERNANLLRVLRGALWCQPSARLHRSARDFEKRGADRFRAVLFDGRGDISGKLRVRSAD